MLQLLVLVALSVSRGDGCADDPEDWCLAIGSMADYCVETGKGHYITYDGLSISVQRPRKTVLFIQLLTLTVKINFAICNCNVNVCYALQNLSCLTHLICLALLLWLTLMKKNVLLAVDALKLPAGAPQLGQAFHRKAKNFYQHRIFPR